MVYCRMKDEPMGFTVTSPAGLVSHDVIGNVW